MSDTQSTCIACERSSEEVPLLALEYRGQKYYICPQDFPTLIHQPQKLIGKLPGAERLEAHNH